MHNYDTFETCEKHLRKVRHDVPLGVGRHASGEAGLTELAREAVATGYGTSTWVASGGLVRPFLRHLGESSFPL